jgi:hypothetical protein
MGHVVSAIMNLPHGWCVSSLNSVKGACFEYSRTLEAEPSANQHPGNLCTSIERAGRCQPSLAAPPAGGLTAPPRCARASLNLPSRLSQKP